MSGAHATTHHDGPACTCAPSSAQRQCQVIAGPLTARGLSLPPSSRALRARMGDGCGPSPQTKARKLLPVDMQLALRRRLRLPLPLAAPRCGGQGKPGCRALVDQFGDHRAACARSGLLARRAPILERAWVRVAREAVAAKGRVVPQQWLAQTTAPGVAPRDRRRLDLVIYGAFWRWRGPLL